MVTAASAGVVAEFVIHACIRDEPNQAPTREVVARAWRAALQQADEWQFVRLAAPLLGAEGAGALPVADVADLLVDVLGQHRARSAFPAEVSFVVDTVDEKALLEAAVRRAAARAS